MELVLIEMYTYREITSFMCCPLRHKTRGLKYTLASHWLLVTGYWLMVIGYWLLVLVTGHWLLVTGHWSLRSLVTLSDVYWLNS